MDSYMKRFMRELLAHQNNLSEFIDDLYNHQDESELNEIFGLLKKEGYVTCIYADNRVYNISLTVKAKYLTDADLKMSDKEELLELIAKTDEIENLFHTLPGEWSGFEEIHDVPEYQMWIQEITIYLQAIFDNTKDQYIWETINKCQRRMNGTDDRKIFGENVARLKGIRKNINKYYKDLSVSEKEVNQVMSKSPLVFISHSSKDKQFVELIVQLLKEMGLKQNVVFCSSIPGYDIGLGEDIFETLHNKFNEHNLYMIFVHSRNYYSSPVSLNEMGAAWAFKTKYSSILLPGFEFSDMRGVVNSSKISLKVDIDRKDVQNRLNQLYDDLANFFGIERNTSVVWESARDMFIDKINTIQVINEDELSEAANNILIEAEKDDNGAVLIDKSLEGTIIVAGKTTINKSGIRREEAKALAAVKELILSGYLLQSDSKGEVFQLTNEAYAYIDKILK